MIDRRLVGIGAGLVLAAVAGWMLAGGGKAVASSLSRDGEGWLRARSYLEQRGVEAITLTRSLTEGPEGTWVLTFPWQYGVLQFDPMEVRRHLEAGGDVLFGYSNGRLPGRAELRLLEEFTSEIPYERLAGSLSPGEWWRERRGLQSLRPVGGWGAQELVLRPLQWRPRLEDSAEVLYETPAGAPAVFWQQVGEGRLLVLPAETLANGRLIDLASVAWLETIAAELQRPWVFDEFHHGVVDPGAVPESAGLVSLDLLLLQVGLVYLAAVWAWSRRMGPSWREPRRVRNTADSFLLGLGRLHHRQGHHGEAAERLLERFADLDRRRGVDDTLRRKAAVVAGSASKRGAAEAFVALCNEIEGRTV